MLAMLLLIGSIPAFAEEYETLNAVRLFTTGYLSTISKYAQTERIGDSVYIHTMQGDIYCYSVPDNATKKLLTGQGTVFYSGETEAEREEAYNNLSEEQKEIVCSSVDWLFNSPAGKTVYGYNLRTHRLCIVEEESVEWLDVSLDSWMSEYNFSFSAYVDGDMIYAFSNEATGLPIETIPCEGGIVRFDMTTGEVSRTAVPGLYAICYAGKDKALTLCRRDEDGQLYLRFYDLQADDFDGEPIWLPDSMTVTEANHAGEDEILFDPITEEPLELVYTGRSAYEVGDVAWGPIYNPETGDMAVIGAQALWIRHADDEEWTACRLSCGSWNEIITNAGGWFFGDKLYINNGSEYLIDWPQEMQKTAQTAADDAVITMFDADYRKAHGMKTGQEGLYLKSMCYAGGAFYAYMTDGCVYRAEVGGAPEVYCTLPEDDDQTGSVTYMATDGETLYGLSFSTGRVCTVDEEGAHWMDVTLDLSALRRESYDDILPRIWADGDTLCALAYNLMGEEEPYSLWMYDLKTGAATRCPVEDLAGACPGAPGEILCLTGYMSGVFSISAYSMADNSEREVISCARAQNEDGMLGGMAYNADSDTLYIATFGKVWRSIAGADFEGMAPGAMTGIMPDTEGWALADGRYAVMLDGMTIYRENDAEIVDLTVMGYVQNDQMELFRKKHPEVSVEFVGQESTQELLDALSTRDSSIDVYMVSADYLFSAMKRKGLAAPLNASEVLVEDVARMDETIAAALCDDEGTIYAYPKELNVRSYGVNLGYWTLFWPDRPYPETFEEMFDAWADYEENIADDYPGTSFIDYSFDYGEWVAKVVELYVLGHDTQTPDLNAEPLKRTLEALERVAEARQAHGRPIDGSYDSRTEPTDMEYCGTVLSLSYSSPMPADRPYYQDRLYGVGTTDFTYLPLRFEKDEESRTDARLDVYVVNPYSEHVDTAIDFIECLAQATTETELYYACHPDCSEPIEDEKYQGRRERMTAQLEETQQAFEEAQQGDQDTSHLEDMIDYYEAWLDSDELRYVISAGMIEAYRTKIAEHPLNLHVDSPYISLNTPASEFIETICRQYAAGQLNLEGMLTQLMDKVEMIRAEND